MTQTGVNVHSWLAHHKLLHFCIEDYQNMDIGDSIYVASFHRNFEEYGIWDKLEAGKAMEATTLLAENKVKLTKIDKWRWKLDFEGVGENTHDVEVSLGSLSTNWTFMPVKGGSVGIINELLSFDQKTPSDRKRFEVDADDLHPRTIIGWRGPMVNWHHIEQAPSMFYANP